LRVKRARIAWKNKGGRIWAMSKEGVYILSDKASRFWESLETESVEKNGDNPLIDSMKNLGLLEIVDE
jgi:hypothetical protein